MSDPDVIALIERMRADMRGRDATVDTQLAKIHDLVNSQLTEAVNRFRDALKTIEELKAALGQKGTPGEGKAALATMEAKQGKDAPPPAPDIPAPVEDASRAAFIEFIDATRAMALRLVEQSERVSALILDKRTRAEAEQQVERRRDRWRPNP